jgi:hypothetical protein
VFLKHWPLCDENFIRGWEERPSRTLDGNPVQPFQTNPRKRSGPGSPKKLDKPTKKRSAKEMGNQGAAEVKAKRTRSSSRNSNNSGKSSFKSSNSGKSSGKSSNSGKSSGKSSNSGKSSGKSSSRGRGKELEPEKPADVEGFSYGAFAETEAGARACLSPCNSEPEDAPDMGNVEGFSAKRFAFATGAGAGAGTGARKGFPFTPVQPQTGSTPSPSLHNQFDITPIVGRLANLEQSAASSEALNRSLEDARDAVKDANQNARDSIAAMAKDKQEITESMLESSKTHCELHVRTARDQTEAYR